mmetsp:Transcript_21565/g.40228  ORF Transcript_21565/g.40228 Transcript_21565/m.40228 type:complete len:751 (+) Transcript_21565:49-2301(+)
MASSSASSSSVLKSGILQMEVNGKYVPQFVELTPTALNYYDKEEKSSFFFKDSAKVKNGSIVIDYHSHIINSTAVSNSGHGFSINRDGNIFKFKANTLKEKKDWIHEIDEAINEEEVDARLSAGGGRTPLLTPQPAAPIDSPEHRSTYKSYLKGNLEVSDSSRTGPWKDRWFILSMEALTYYKSAETTTHTSDRKGSAVISQSTEIHIEDNDDDENRSHKNIYVFRLQNQGHCIFLAAATEESRLQWIDSIHSVKKMNLCRWEGDLATMWTWERHLKATMSVESMPTDSKLKLRSASIFGFRPSFGKDDDDGDNDKDLLPSVKSIVPTGLNSVFDSIESGAQDTFSGISSGVKKTASGLAKGLEHVDSGRRLVQGTIVDGIVDGADSLQRTVNRLPSFSRHETEDFEARRDSFCEYMQDDEIEVEDMHEDANGTWQNSGTKNITAELTSKLVAIAIGMGALALLLGLFISYSTLFDLGNIILVLECSTMGLLLFLSHQQILGYLAGMAVRYKLTESVHGDGTKFDLHFEAIKVSIGADLCEVEVRDLKWGNPDVFQGHYGKYFLSIKSIRVKVPTLSLFRVIIDKKRVLKIDQVFIDSPLVTLAQLGEDKHVMYNVTSAVGQAEQASGHEAPSPPPEDPTPTSNVPPFCFDLNSFVLLNLRVRLRNIFKVSCTDLDVPHVVMTRPELTAPPRTDHRIPLPVSQLLSAIIKEVGSELVTENKVAMLGILSSSGARHLMALFDPRNLAKIFS